MAVVNKGAASSSGANASAPGAGAASSDGKGELSKAETIALFMAPDPEAPAAGAKGTKPAEADPEADPESEEDEHLDPEVDVETDPEEDPDADTDTEIDPEVDPETEGLGHLEKGLLKALAGDEHKGLRKRMSSIFKQNKGFKEEIATLKATVEGGQAAPVVLQGVPEVPLGHVATAADLDKLVEAAELWLEWCEENPEGGAPPGVEKELTKEDVKSYKNGAKQTLKQVPARREYLQKYQTTHAALVKEHPDLAKPDSALRKQAEEVLKGNPALVASPTYLQDVMDLLEGRRLREERAKGIKYVKVDAKTPAKGKEEPAAPGARKPAAGTGSVTPQRPAPNGAAKGGGVADLKTLRAQAAQGNASAKKALAEQFMAPA